MKDIFSFFEKPSYEHEGIRVTKALARAAGLELTREEQGLRIQIASDDGAHAWSHGEVTSKEMLRAQKIFGPVADYRCECGKHSRMKHRGVRCETCGVEVIQSKVRRERLGHIRLPSPATPRGFDRAWTVVPVMPPDIRPADFDLVYAHVFADPAGAVDAVVGMTLDLLIRTMAPSAPRRLDYSASAVALVGERRRAPLELLAAITRPLLYGISERLGYTTTIKSAKKLIASRPEYTREFVRMALHDRVVLFAGNNREVVGATVEIGEHPVVELDRDTASRLGVSTGDIVSVFLPISDAGQAAAKSLSSGKTPLLANADDSSWVRDVAQATDGIACLLDHAMRGSLDPCTWPAAALLVGGYPHEGPRAPAIELGPPPGADPGRRNEDKSPNPHLDRLVDDLELSVRSANVLLHAEVKTIRDLVQRTEMDLLKLPNCGAKCIKELKEVLAEMGLTLGMRV